MGRWSRSAVTYGLGGFFRVVMTRVGVLDSFTTIMGRPKDVTRFRGAQTVISSITEGDPFGDATAVLSFPRLTGYDDLDSPEVGSWLGDNADVDIWWVPGVKFSDFTEATDTVKRTMMRYLNPVTEALPDTEADILLAPAMHWAGATPTTRRGLKVFEGFVASLEVELDDQGSRIQAQCQGALYQDDRYLQKPFYPPNPQTLESLIAGAFDRTYRPHLRTQPLIIDWPSSWSKVAPNWESDSDIYVPNVRPGQKWSGYTSRATGAWDRALTGFVQDQISVMITQPDSGVAPGNQWTVLNRRALNDVVGRQPILTVRDRFRTPDFSLWFGADGIKASLTRDSTQMANVIYGDGTDVSGTVWRNAVVSNDGTRTDYVPLAASPEIYPPVGNEHFNPRAFASEAYVKYGSGFNQPDAVTSSQQTLRRDIDPGWAGTITISVDPVQMSRWTISAGMTLRFQGFMGSGTVGVNFHVSQVQKSPEAGTVELTVDTRYRDLLNLSQAIARTRDPLTPSKLLQINRRSAVIEDIQAPWDYSAGSGFIPRASTRFYGNIPVREFFPYADYTSHHPPFLYPSSYVRCVADATTRRGRWSGPVPILMSEKGTIARSQFFCVDRVGQPVAIPFHVSLYYVNVTTAAMPFDGDGPSPFIPGAFTSINPLTGQPWVQGEGGKFNLPGPDSMLMCWGNASQPAGYSPGVYADANGPTGDHPTGLLVDDGQWTFDCTNNSNYNRQLKAGQTEPQSAITIYAMFYAQHSEPVYFGGRLYRQPQGV